MQSYIARFLRSFFSFFFIESLAEYTSFRGVCTRDGTLSSELFRFPFRFFFSFSLFFFFSAARCPRASDRSF